MNNRNSVCKLVSSFPKNIFLSEKSALGMKSSILIETAKENRLITWYCKKLSQWNYLSFKSDFDGILK